MILFMLFKMAYSVTKSLYYVDWPIHVYDHCYSWGQEIPDARIFDTENQFRALRTTCHKLFTND
jgi:hypothetical protein